MRSIWSGIVSFGLMHIPVKLFSAVQQTELDLDLLSKKDLAPIRYARIDSETGEEVPWKDVVKGFQYAKGKYVVVTDDDLKKASPEKTKSIDISQFVKEEEIDPVYFEKPYYLMPDKGAAKAYRLLVKALQTSGTAGIAEFMLRNRVHICAVRASKEGLLLHQLHYPETIQKRPQAEETTEEKVSARELELAVQLIEQLSAPFEPAALKDTYISELKKIIKAKAAGKKIRIAEPKMPEATVKDLMAVLKQSLDHTKKIA